MYYYRYGGTALYAGFQSSIVNNDRIICSSAISSMGTGLAETIGVGKAIIFKKYMHYRRWKFFDVKIYSILLK